MAAPASRSSRTNPPWPPALGETTSWPFLIAAVPLSVRFVELVPVKSFVNDPPSTVVAERRVSAVLIKKRIIPQKQCEVSDKACPLRRDCFGRPASPPL